jgi:hypothetical protein
VTGQVLFGLIQRAVIVLRHHTHDNTLTV